MKAIFFAPILLFVVGATAQTDKTQYLGGHNSFRSHFPVPALEWSEQLAANAQEWANNCKFKHSGDKFGSVGENLAAGAGGGYDIASAIKSWTDEENDYSRSDPRPSHFTQVVWKASTHVGCAKAMCDGIFDPKYGKALFVVCQYSPPGNVNGKFAANVPPRK